jgi:putative transposase
MPQATVTEAQMTSTLRHGEAGTPVAEVCSKWGASEQTVYRWERQFAGLGVAERRRRRQPEAENRQLKPLVADLRLGKYMRQAGIRKRLSNRPSAGCWCRVCEAAFP